MNIKKFTTEDYKILDFWYSEWDLPKTPISWISDTSYFVFSDEIPVCFGSLYQLGNTPMYWVEGLISNKDLDSSIKKAGISELINHFNSLQKDLNIEILLTSTPRESLKQLFESNNFRKTPENYYHLARIF